MKKILIPILLFLTVFSFTEGVCAQDGDLDYTGKIARSYDAASDSTQIEVRRIPITADKLSLSELGITVNHPGKALTSKPEFILFIMSLVNAKGHRYPDRNNVTFISGGNEIDNSIVILNLDQRPYDDTETLETVGTRMPMKVFQKLAASRQAITFKFAETSITLNAAVITKLAEFEKAITP